MRRPLVSLLSILTVAIMCSGCAFHTTAGRWNGRVDAKGQPVYYSATTKVGFKLLVFVPFLGDLGVAGLVDDLTKHIEEKGGDEVRIVQGDSENYWYAWSPLTWILTPVVSTVSAEYKPTEEEMQQYAGPPEERKSVWMPWTW